MAALILGAGALAYDQVQKGRAKRKARKEFNDQRFSELERENAERINGLQSDTCFCERSDWEGRCPVHGDGEGRGVGNSGGRAVEGRREGNPEPPAYVDVTGDGGGERGREEEEGEHVGGARPTAGAPETEVERLRINEERRKIMRKDKGFKGLFGRKKGGQEMVGA